MQKLHEKTFVGAGLDLESEKLEEEFSGEVDPLARASFNQLDGGPCSSCEHSLLTDDSSRCSSCAMSSTLIFCYDSCWEREGRGGGV